MALLTNTSIDEYVLSLGMLTLNAAPEDWAAMISLDLFASMHLSEQRVRFQETLCWAAMYLKGGFLLKVWILLESFLIVAFCFSFFNQLFVLLK